MQTMSTNSDQSQATVGLHIRGLNYSYGGVQIFKDFSLDADSAVIVLRGPSGCGKTTLLKLLSGNLLPGKVQFMPSARDTCLVLQEDSLLPWLSGSENISKFTGVKTAGFMQHPMHKLIAAFIEHKACNMSYGQRRMVELFRAIVFKPRALYLDEPFNFLDEDNMALIVPFLQDFAREGRTLVLSNHHKEDGDIIKAAEIYKFDGRLPVKSLTRVN
jgi:ABC-type multidrug transport system ATPase subunit